MFYIGFTTPPRTDEEGWPHALGGVDLGSESDAFAADLGSWRPSDYERQWRAGVARLAAGHGSTALITSYAGPNADFHAMRPMWRVGGTVFVQDRLVLGELVATGAAEEFYALVGERRTVSDNGELISEWSVPFADVVAFLADG
jgi:hypothetical protein